MQRETANSPRGASEGRSASIRDRAAGMIVFAILLALLYFGRAVLIPFTAALILSLLIAPFVRALRRIRLGQTSSVLVAVLTCSLAFAGAAAFLGTQFLRMAASLPQYEQTIRKKIRQFDALTVGRLDALTREASRLAETRAAKEARTSPTAGAPMPASTPALSSLPGDRDEHLNPFESLARVLATVWPPIATTGIVLVVLIFVLLEHEALRDRFIRLAGSTNIRLTTLALNDAGERLSRFFVSQFAVNLAVGGVITLGLALLGLPNAALWGALATLLRFVPYVGVWLAAILATVLALAVAPGWWLAISVFATFVLVELVAGQIVEPHLYGHATGLSPLSVVVAAIFWSSLWGPIGLILSTPLTLCLLVIGRHTKALSFLELLLADRQALTPPQSFYQRVLAGDADEIIASARVFLKSNSFAEYCDQVLLPALHLGSLDFAARAISRDQQLEMRNVVVTVVSALAGEKPTRLPRQRRSSVLDTRGPGTLLRLQRERLTAERREDEAPAPALLCIGLGLPAHVLAAELLVRALREENLHADHISIEELDGWSAGPHANAADVVYVVSAFPGEEPADLDRLAERLRAVLPDVLLVSVTLPGLSAESGADVGEADYVVTSFVEAIQLGIDRQHSRRARERPSPGLTSPQPRS